MSQHDINYQELSTHKGVLKDVICSSPGITALAESKREGGMEGGREGGREGEKEREKERERNGGVWKERVGCYNSAHMYRILALQLKLPFTS